MDKEELNSLIKTTQPNICQIVAYRNGEKLYSECWNDYKPDDAVHIMSATKSIMALLIGIAIDKRQINSIEDKVLDYFPDYKVINRISNLEVNYIIIFEKHCKFIFLML